MSDPDLSNPPKSASSVKDVNSHRAPFGSRFLKNESDVWNYNSWDHVPPPDDQGDIVAAALAKQHAAPVSDEDKQKLNTRPSKNWEKFYKTNKSNFFRDRNWQAQQLSSKLAAARAGNTVYPVLSVNKNPDLSLYAFDYASQAVKLVQNHEMYENPPCGSIKASVWDLSGESLPECLEPETVDIAVMIFVLSALHPDEWYRAVSNVHKMLKPGGLLLLRDYGRHDLAQLRFKAGRLLEDNFYVRGDKTRVYFFELDELALMFTGAKAPADKVINHQSTFEEVEQEEEQDISEPASMAASPAPPEEPSISAPETPPAPSATSNVHPNLKSETFTNLIHPLFKVEQLGADRRLLVNRKRQLKMYRVWMQGKFRKLEDNAQR